MNDLITKDASGAIKRAPGGQLELKAEDSGIGKVAGWASTPMPDVVDHVVANGAFAESIARKGLQGPQAVQLLMDHDSRKPMGRITRLEYRTKGLWIEADIDLNISYAKDRYHAAKAQGGFSFSVGFRPGREPGDLEWVDTDEGEILVIRKGELREVSVVLNPANSEAVMEFIKSDEPVPAAFAEQATIRKWEVGASRALPVAAVAWDAEAAAARVLKAAKVGDSDTADFIMARKGFLVYDADQPFRKSSYRFPFADIVEGRVQVSPAGLKAAAAELEKADLPANVKARARDVVDSYLARFEKAAENLTLPELRNLLVAEGWVKSEQAADGLMAIIKANIGLFTEEPPAAPAGGTFEKALERLRGYRATINKEG